MKKLFLLITISLLLTGCTGKNWTGYYYRDKDHMEDQSTWLIQTGFKNLEDCKKWISKETTFWEDKNSDFECGYGCRFDNNLHINVCEQTAK